MRNKYKISSFQKMALAWIFEKVVRQSEHHRDNIKCVLTILRTAVNEEFTEDSEWSLNHFMGEIFNETQWQEPPTGSP